jgi:hypothetical protein
MIRPRLPKVATGTRLTTDLVNDIINRTEYAADLLRKYKLIAGTEMYIEPHYDGTRVSYFSPVGSGNNPVVPLPVYKYRLIENLPSLNIVAGGPSSLNTTVQLQRYTGTGGVGDPIVPKPWVTPINYIVRFSVGFLPFGSFASAPVTGEFVNISHVFTQLAINASGLRQVLVFLVNQKTGFFESFIDGYVSYPYNPTITITSSSIPVGSAERLSFSYIIGPLVDFSPVEVSVEMSYGSVGTVESFNISATSIFSSGSFLSSRTFDTNSGNPVGVKVTTYFKSITDSVGPE